MLSLSPIWEVIKLNTTKRNLFYNINEEELLSMMTCFKTYTKNYSNGEIICFYSDNDNGIGIIESGSAIVVHSLLNGSQTILEHLKEGDIFGQMFYFHGAKENISVEASSKCTVRFIDYEHIVKRCSKACPHHSQLVHNILFMVSEKTRNVCEHLEVLSQRSIRERLNSYFEILSSKADNKTFEIPFTMTTLANYLSVDRSAMSRELGKMKDEGLLKINKKKITLL